MTHFHILGPPRHGRQVKSEAQVLEEIRSMKRKSKSDPALAPSKQSPPQKNSFNQRARSRPVVGPIQGIVPSILSSYFVAPGRFNVGSITKECYNYVFNDLELPMGSWKELTLFRELLPGGPRSFEDWSEFTASAQPVGVIPADIRYGLMAVCYLNKDQSGFRSIIEEILSDVWIPDMQGLYPHNSTIIKYRSQDSALITVGASWSLTHPFSGIHEANIAGPISDISNSAALLDPSILCALEGLLGENDPKRCESILEWGMDSRRAKLFRWSGAESGDRLVVFGATTTSSYGGIYANNSDCVDPRPARAIRADKKYYLPK